MVLLLGGVLSGCSPKRWADIEPGEYAPVQGIGQSNEAAVQAIQTLRIDRDENTAVFTLTDGSELVTTFTPRVSKEWPGGCPTNIYSTYMEVLDIERDTLTIETLTFRDPILVRNCPPDPVRVALREDGEIGGSGTACTGSDECLLFGIPSASAPPAEPPTPAAPVHTPTSISPTKTPTPVSPTDTPTLVPPTSAPTLTPPATTSETQGIELAGHIGGAPRAIFGRGNYVYLGLGAELTILDVSNPPYPVRIGYVVLPDIVQDIYVVGDYAYVANDESGLRLVNVSDPANPFEVGAYNTPGNAWGVFVNDRLAYVADGESGLRVFDVSDPTAPAEVGFYDTTLQFARDVIEAGNHVYIVTSSGPVLMVDVSDPTVPVEVGRYEAPEYVWDVEVRGDNAYVVAGSPELEGLQILDISNPATPTQIGLHSTGDAFSALHPQEVAVAGTYAYLVGSGGMRVVDVSDATGPTLVGAYDTLWFKEWTNKRAGNGGTSTDTPSAPSWNSPRLMVMNDYAYVADSQAGLHVLDVSDPAAPMEVGLYRTPSRPSDVTLDGDYAYVHDLSGGLHVLNVSDPSNPVGVGFYELYPSGADANGVVALHRNYETGFIDPPGASTVAVQGDYVYIIDKVALALRVIDVSNPAVPVAVGFWDGLGYPLSLAVVDGYTYIVGGDSRMIGNSKLWVIDSSKPSAPVEVGATGLPGMGAIDLAVLDERAYVAVLNSGVRVVDVSDPTTPIEIGPYDSNEAGIENAERVLAGDYAYFSEAAQDVEVENGYAYITILDASYSDGIEECVQCGLQVMDISDPTAPAEIDFYSLPYPKGVTVTNGYAYVSSPAGLYILQYGSYRNVSSRNLRVPSKCPAA